MGDHAEAGDIEQEGRREVKPVEDLQRANGRVPSLLDNIFNPFFTTKEKASGPGLAISNKIVMHHNGHIEVRSRAGEGAIFVVYLPLNSKTLTREG
ncbi:MAG TPA: ATP-binding protein [Syntrophorhabdales bacterium]|nr:ATP-binding protein [Syntrophorhabdales bacterium]